MKHYFQFSQKKFLSLPTAQQHKKCAEMLRMLYAATPDGEGVANLAVTYDKVQKWMALLPLGHVDVETVADRYHHHLRCARQSLKEHNFLPRVRRGDRKEAMRPLLIAVYLDNLRSAYNVGSIIRTAEAFALGPLFFSMDTPFIDHKQVRDAAMGADQWVRCCQVSELSSLPKPLLAMETSPQASSVDGYPFPRSFTLALGNEEYGCSHDLLAEADDLIEIPLFGKKNSLNVANAFAVVAAAVRRQSLLYKEG